MVGCHKAYHYGFPCHYIFLYVVKFTAYKFRTYVMSLIVRVYDYICYEICIAAVTDDACHTDRFIVTDCYAEIK